MDLHERARRLNEVGGCKALVDGEMKDAVAVVHEGGIWLEVDGEPVCRISDKALKGQVG